MDQDVEDRETDRSAISKIFRLIKEMTGVGEARRPKRPRRQQKRFGKGPGGEKDMDVDSDSEDEDDEDYDPGMGLSIVDVRSRVLGAGYTETDLADTIAEYERIDIWQRQANGTKLVFVQNDDK